MTYCHPFLPSHVDDVIKAVEDELTRKQVEDELTRKHVEDELTRKHVEDELTRKQVEDELSRKQVEDELTRKHVEDELTRKHVEDELTRKQVEDELSRKQVEDELTQEHVEVDNIAQEVGLARGRCRQIWDLLRQNARWAAVFLGGLAVTLICSATATGIAEGNNPLWIASLSVVVVLLAVALIAFCLAFQDVSQAQQVSSEVPAV